MSLSKVEQALLTAVGTALNAIPTAYENVKFDKPSGSKWASVYFIPNLPSVETLGGAGQDMVDGIVQIDLNYPMDQGDATARADFETIRGSFKAGTRLTQSGQQAVVLSCGRSSGRPVDGWYRIVITIGWYALIPR